MTRPAYVPPHTLHVCRTCPRYEPAPPPGTAGRGEALARRVKALVRDWPHRAEVAVLAVNCLGGCRHPCNAAISGPGKLRLRFSRLEAPDAESLLEAAARHLASADGDLADEALPPRLRDRLSARAPAAVPIHGA